MISPGLALKVGAGIAGIGGVGVGGCYVAGVFGGGKGSGNSASGRKITAEVLGEGNKRVDKDDRIDDKVSWKEKKSDIWSPQEMDTFQPTRENTFGKKYGRYLIGVYGHGENQDAQKEMWAKIYEKDYKRDFVEDENGDTGKSDYHNQIQTWSDSITQAFSSSTESTVDSLNLMCKEIYSKPMTDFEGAHGNKLLKGALNLCSTVTEGIVKGSGDGYGEEAKAGTIWHEKREYLVNVNEGNSNKFWELQDRWFRSIKEQVTDPFFKPYAFFDGNEQNAVKGACTVAYEKSKDTTVATADAPIIDDVLKYCTFVEIG